MNNPRLLAAIPPLLALLLGACGKTTTAIRTLADAQHAKIGVMTGTTGEAIAKQKFPQAEIKSFDDVMDAVGALKAGQLDGVVTSYSTAFQVSKKNPELQLLPDHLTDEDTSIGLRKGSGEMLAAIDKVIADLKSEGTLDAMKKRWFKEDLSPYDEPKLDVPVDGQPLRIGVSATREPFQFVDKDGRVTGHDGEMARRIAIALKRPVEFSNMKFMALIPALQSGKIDMIVAGMTATKERSQFVDFSNPYFYNAQIMMVKKSGETVTSGPKKMVSTAEIADKRIGVLQGSAHDVYATKTYPKAQILQYRTAADIALAVKAGKVDVALYDHESLQDILRDEPALGMLGDSLFSSLVGVGFNKGSDDLRTSFNRFLADIRKNGVYNDMVDRWINKRETKMPEIPRKPPTGSIIAGISTGGAPFTFIQDNVLLGFDIEMLNRFGASIGKDIKYSDMDFGGLVAAVATRKVDLIAASIYITEERLKQINFSDPYFEQGNRVFALKSNIAAFNVQAEASGPKKMASTAEIADKRIGVLQGSAHDVYATKTYPKAQILQYRTATDVALAVKAGKVDVAIYDHESLQDILHDEPSLGMLGDSLFSSLVGIGFNKGSDDLRTSFNSFLAEIKKNGVYNDMVERWINKRETKMPEIPRKPTTGSITAGISTLGAPFTFMKDNVVLGFDIEMLNRFGAATGKEIKYLDMEFGGLVSAVATRKVDLIAASIFITQERLKQINFSDPYFEQGNRVFALKSNIAAFNVDAAAKPAASRSFFDSVAASFRSNILEEKRYLLILDGLKTTATLSILATLFGTLLGAFVCFLRMSPIRLLSGIGRVYISIVRGTPVLVLLMLIFYVVFASVDISPVLVATIAFGMNFAAYVSEIFRTGIEGVDSGQSEAGIAMGFSKVETFLHVVLPQTARRILPVYKGEFISLVKMTSIVGYIAVQDLTKASDIIRSRTFDAFFPLIMVAILYFSISWILMQALDYLERVTDPKQNRRKAATA